MVSLVDRTVLTVVAVAVLAGGTSFYGRATSRGTDFNVFYLGGHLVTKAPEELYERASKRGSTYTFLNPPFFAILMGPLAALPIGVSAVVWFVVNVVCTGHSAWILSGLLVPPGLTAAFLAMTLLLALPYTLENIFLGQLHAVILYLMVLSFAAIRRRRGAIVGAAGVAVTTTIKLLPARHYVAVPPPAPAPRPDDPNRLAPLGGVVPAGEDLARGVVDLQHAPQTRDAAPAGDQPEGLVADEIAPAVIVAQVAGLGPQVEEHRGFFKPASQHPLAGGGTGVDGFGDDATEAMRLQPR